MFMSVLTIVAMLVLVLFPVLIPGAVAVVPAVWRVVRPVGGMVARIAGVPRAALRPAV
ncbi:hypothetical protein MGAST_10250 [Mycobacterium gastri 'Wayne']|nr:hypothetical protein MGAST_10250 [Mycobacterium gastri 'Wayne']